ncbi:MAG: cysteine desulfurase [Oscillospiraceae bacterium]|nr:cysteine desulfurase [Oscillospiraceae bacterium]MBR0450943.1 cysteine desulfurase [Oscillospiraceae bacterium]
MIYLDNAATTNVFPEVAEVIASVLRDSFGNPSSLYSLGIESKKIVDRSRAQIARAMGCDPSEVYFTSCGTESNNLAILGAARSRKAWGNKVIVSGIEHPSVQNTAASLANEGFEVVVIPPEEDGNLSIDGFLNEVDKRTVLVTCMRVNNETGALTDTALLAKKVKEINRRTAFHCDAVQSFMKHTTALDGSIDSMSVSGHKIHGPKGIGVLYLRKGFSLEKTQFGGGQEKGMRSGTENVAYIAGMAKAVELIGPVRKNLEHVGICRNILWDSIRNLPEVRLNSPESASPYILNISVLGYRSETMLHFLESEGVFVSSGSACSKGEKSHTLEAMCLDDDRVDSALRFSLSAETTEDDVKTAAEALKKGIKTLERK